MQPELIPPAQNVLQSAATLHVHARPHPGAETVYAEFRAGLTLREILGSGARSCRVEVGGVVVFEEWWGYIRPRVGVVVVITRMPEGGGGAKSIFRLIAFAALVVGSVLITQGAAAGLIGGLFESGSLSAGLLAAGVGMVGSLLINALIPPSNPGTADTASTATLRSITGAQNRLNPFGAVPIVFGECKVFPPLAAKPYSELSGDDQYLRMLLDLGQGNPVASDWKIGDTDLASYTDVETETGISPSLFPQGIDEETAGDALNTDGNSAIRTSGSNAVELSIDLGYLGGLFGADSAGKVVSVTNVVRVEYAVAGSGSWQSVTASTSGLTISNAACSPNSDGTFHVTNAAKKAVRVGIRWQVPVNQYDIRVTRVSTDWGSSTSDGKVGDLTWTVIRTIRTGQVSTTGTLKFALRIKASDQLSGNISNLSCILAQQIPVWNPTTQQWVTEVSDNPAWQMRWLMTSCPANSRTIDAARLMDDEIKDWGADCDANGYGYNNCVDQFTTIAALLDDICAAGRATKNQRDGKYTIVRDTPQTTPVQVFTPRNSWGFSGSRAFPDAVHALRVQFTNPAADWQQDERIVYDDGYGDAAMLAANPALALATKFETLPLRGVTDGDQAWKLGRYHMAVSRLRPNTYTFNADIENLVCTRGDMVMLATDVIDVGLAYGRITDMQVDGSGNAVNLTTDEKLPRNDACTIRVRRQDGSFSLSQVTLPGDGVDSQSADLATPLAGVNIGDLFIYGVAGQDTIALKVSRIDPGDDLSAKLTAVDAAPAVLNAAAGPVPVWNSSITGQAQIAAPPAPTSVDVSSSQILSPSDDGGITQPVLIVAVSGPWSGVASSAQTQVDHVEVRYRTADPVGAWTVLSLAKGEFTTTIANITRDVEYQVEARAVGASGRASVWTGITHTTAGATLAPGEIPSLSVALTQPPQDNGSGGYGPSDVRVQWTAVSQANVTYQMESTDGTPSSSNDNTVPWIQQFSGNGLISYDSIGSGSTRYYRVRAVTTAGVPSQWSDLAEYTGQ